MADKKITAQPDISASEFDAGVFFVDHADGDRKVSGASLKELVAAAASRSSVASQTELDSVSTSGVAFAKVTAAFGSYDSGDILFYDGSSWSTFIDASDLGSTGKALSDANFPATDPVDGTLFFFNADQSTFTSGKTVRNDADDGDVTEAFEGDLFKYFATGTKWVRQYEARAPVADWAETGNTTVIPSSKLPNRTLSGDNFPGTDPADGTLFFFNAAQSTFTSGKTVRNDDDSADITSAAEGDLFKYFATGTKWVRQYQAAAASGLSESEVDARVAAGVADWAEQGNTSEIPSNKLPNRSLSGDNFPGTDPADGTLFFFNAAQTTFTSGKTVRNDDDSADVTSASEGDLFKYFSSGTKWIRQYEAAVLGLSESEVDARVAAGVADWAEQGNTSEIPSSKLPNRTLSGDNFPGTDPADGTLFFFNADQSTFTSGKTVRNDDDSADVASASEGDLFKYFASGTKWIRQYQAAASGLSESEVDARVAAGVADWAEQGNTSEIPSSKLPNRTLSGNNFPGTDPADGTLFFFNADQTSFTSGKTVRNDADDGDVTSASEGDLFKYFATGTKWVRQYEATTAPATWAESGNTTEIPSNKLPNRTLSGDNFPATDPVDGTLFFFNANQSTFTSGKTVRNDADDGDVSSATEGDLFKYFSTDTKWVRQYQASAFGLSQSEVDARVAANVEDWAEEGNTDVIPSDKLPNRTLSGDNFPGTDPADGTLFFFNADQSTFTSGKTVRNDADTANVTSASEGDLFKYFSTGTKWVRQYQAAASGLSESEVDARVAANVEDWAEEGNTDVIPSDKLPNRTLSGDNFPGTDPADGTLFFFNADQSTFTSGKTVRNDADTANVTSASEGDLFKYFSTGTKWVRQYRTLEASQLDAVIHVAEADEDDAGTISPAQLEEFLDWHLYDRSVARLVVASNNPTYSGNHMSVVNASGDEYRVKINAAGFSGYAAIDDRLVAGVSIGQKIRLYSASNNIHWEGEVSGEAVRDAAGIYTFEVSFPSRSGTIGIGNVLTIYFGFATSGAFDQIANAEFDLLWRHVTDFSSGASSSSTNRNLISGRNFTDYSTIVFWFANKYANDAEGSFMDVPLSLWQDISNGIGDESAGEVFMGISDKTVGVRYIDSDSFRIVYVNNGRLRAVFGMRGL